MTLKEIFDQLALSELSQTSLGGADSGEISTDNYVRIANHINMALLALHKRFLIKEEESILTLEEDKYTYTILDPNLIKVERIYGDSGEEFKINDLNSLYAIQIPKKKELKVPEAIVNKASTVPLAYQTETLKVVYRANHPKLTEDVAYDFPEDVEIDLPDVYFQALLYYIASRVHNPIGMMNEFHAGNSYYAKYEAECIRIEAEGMNLSNAGQAERIQRNGWV